MAPDPVRDVVRQVVADNIRAARARTRLKQDAVAKRMVAMGFSTWSRSTVSQIEHTNRPVGIEELVALAGIFGVEATDLLYGDAASRRLRAEVALWATRHNAAIRAEEMEAAGASDEEIGKVVLPMIAAAERAAAAYKAGAEPDPDDIAVLRRSTGGG